MGWTGLAGLVYFRVVVAFRVLQADDHLRPVLHLQVCLEDFDMHLFAFCREGAGGSRVVEGYVAIVRFEELSKGGGGGHGTHECRSWKSCLAIPRKP